MIKINKKFLLIFLGAFLYAFFEGGYFANAIFICLVIVALFSFMYILITAKLMKVEITKLKNSFITGEKIEINISLQNKNFIPVNYIEIKYNEDINWSNESSADIFNLKGKEVKHMKMHTTFYIRGIYNITDISLIIKDVFNILYFKRSLNDEISVKIYPRVLQINNFHNNSQEKQVVGTNLLGNIESNVFTKDIRKYKVGDNLKRIHWKVSAKYGELYTKNYETYSNEVYNIFLDMNKEIYKEEDGDIIEERTIEFLLSFCKYLLDRNISSILNINNEKSIKFVLEKSRDIKDIEEYFLHNKSLGKEDLVYNMGFNFNKLNKRESIIIIIPFLREEVWKKALKLIQLGYKFKIFYYKIDSEMLYQKDMLKDMGIECISFKGIVDNF
ncbi:DUF58 domain-containing protein [Clostridium tetani]|nr:DUF58 domain-containing protein [Clostridium tetani]QBD86454.1 DUF58 domain-containing protein [Clostridium tetani]